MATMVPASVRAIRQGGLGSLPESCICLRPPRPSKCSNSGRQLLLQKWRSHGLTRPGVRLAQSK
jgi:hypothetical protein